MIYLRAGLLSTCIVIEAHSDIFKGRAVKYMYSN